MAGNKRISQLVELTAGEVVNDDLFPIVDTSVHETKRIKVSQLSSYLNSSGSITAIYALEADTASYILGSNVQGAIASSSYSLLSTTSISSSLATNALDSISSSYAKTASWAINSISGGTTITTGSTYPITSSWSVNSDYSKTSSFLLYTPGVFNGTSSYSLTSSRANIADTSSTASYVNVLSLGIIPSASWANNSVTSQQSTTSTSASFLVFSPNNGTSSYALSAGSYNFGSSMRNYGMTQALVQSSSVAYINKITVQDSSTAAKDTMIQAIGTVILEYTASTDNSGIVNLKLTDRYTGITQSIDSSNISFNIAPSVYLWDNLATGSVKITFDLVGQTSLYGDYFLEVTSSTPYLTFDSSRNVRFIISSYSDVMTATTAELIDFYISPTASVGNSANITFSSIVGGPFYDNLTGLLSSGSNNIIKMDIDGTNRISSEKITDVKYTWKCTNLTHFSCSNNYIQTLNYQFPDTMSYLYCNNNIINHIADLDNTSLVYLDCSNNLLTSLPALPSSMSYLDCSDNLITSLSGSLPSQLTRLYANNIDISLPPSSFPVTLLTMSFISCSNLLALTNLPVSLSMLTADWCPLIYISTLPTSMSYLSISNCELYMVLENITSDLVTNGLESGSLNILGNGIPNLATAGNLSQLKNVKGWNVQYDT